MVNLREALRLVIAMAATMATTFFLTMSGCGENKPGNIYLLSYYGILFALARIAVPLLEYYEPRFPVRARANRLRNPSRVHTAAWLVSIATSIYCTKYYMGQVVVDVDVFLLLWVASFAAEICFNHLCLVSEFQCGWVQYMFWVLAWVVGIVARGLWSPLNHLSIRFAASIVGAILLYEIVLHCLCPDHIAAADDDD